MGRAWLFYLYNYSLGGDVDFVIGGCAERIILDYAPQISAVSGSTFWIRTDVSRGSQRLLGGKN
jgi:hypothetical protein